MLGKCFYCIKPIGGKFILRCDLDLKKFPIRLPKYYKECMNIQIDSLCALDILFGLWKRNDDFFVIESFYYYCQTIFLLL